METTFIYALKEPETGEIRYVGKTGAPKERLRCHLKDAAQGKQNHRAHWINFLKTRGHEPVLEILDEVPVEHWPQWEVAYIEFFLGQGCRLVNGTNGGEGAGSGEKHPNHGKPGWMTGRKHSEEAKEKCRAARLKQIITPDVYARAGVKRIGNKNKGASSAFYGVFWNGEKKKWQARIITQKKQVFLGLYLVETDAARAFDVAAKKYRGEFAKLNFP